MCDYHMYFIHFLVKVKFWFLLTRTMSSVNDIGASFAESAEARRERRLQRRRERERAHCASETAEQWEERLSRRRIKDRARPRLLNKEKRFYKLDRKGWSGRNEYNR